MVADDFTGACDTGLQFARSGLRTFVFTDLEDGSAPQIDADVLVLDTESRNCDPVKAERLVQTACSKLSGVRTRLFYKKVDSALRGNLATEIWATMQGFGLNLCFFAPALPDEGRVTVDGHHFVDGVPVHRTEVGRDPGSPVRDSRLSSLLGGEPRIGVTSMDLEKVQKGPEEISRSLKSLGGSKPTVVVFDATTPEDLKSIAISAARRAVPPLLCGSAGLAGQVPDAFGLEGSRGIRDVHLGSGPLLFAIGTSESETRQQVRALCGELGIQEWEIALEASTPERRDALVEEVSARLSSGRDAVVSVAGLGQGAKEEVVAGAIRELARIVRCLVEEASPASVISSGGWTTSEILQAMDGTGAEILGGIAPNMPIYKIVGGPFRGFRMATKGGALGEKGVFVNTAKRVRPDPGKGHDRDRPILGLTMGDPCGIGPEIIAKALCRRDIFDLCRPVVIGDVDILSDNLKFAGRELEINPIAAAGDGRYEWGVIDICEPVNLELSTIRPGRVFPEAGRAAVEWVLAAVDMAMSGQTDGLVTAPLNKEAMNKAGFPYAGHTELIGDRTEAKTPRLMLVSKRLNVVHVTTHIAFREVPNLLTQERVFDTIVLAGRAMKDLGIPEPRIVVAGLNPHAGEARLFGREDAETILPAVERASREGWDVTGPMSPDATFFKAYNGDFDVVVAIYHDQGHIPIKLVAFNDAVNVTLGLPIVRTSVDHGTAFDIAWKGIADETNLLRAIELAAEMSVRRKG